MARIVYGGGVTEITGSIGGWTFQRNLAGTIVRLRPIQRKRQSNKQTLIHSVLQGDIVEWNNLSLINKGLWNTYASAHDYVNKFGQDTVASGFNWFYGNNFYRELTGKAQFTVPPTYATPAAIVDYTFTLEVATIFFDYNSGFYDINTGVLVYATSYVKRATSIWRPPMRYIQYVDSPGVSNIIITTDWETAHGLDYPPNNTPAEITIQAMLVPIQKNSAVLGAPVVYQAERSFP